MSSKSTTGPAGRPHRRSASAAAAPSTTTTHSPDGVRASKRAISSSSVPRANSSVGLVNSRAAAGGFVEDECAGGVAEAFEGRGALVGIARGEAFEGEAEGGKAASGEGGDKGSGAGDRDDGDAMIDREADQLVTGVGDAGHAG